MIGSLRSREKMSNACVPRPVCSTTIGIRAIGHLLAAFVRMIRRPPCVCWRARPTQTARLAVFVSSSDREVSARLGGPRYRRRRSASAPAPEERVGLKDGGPLTSGGVAPRLALDFGEC